MRLKPITDEYFKLKQLFEESLESKSSHEKNMHYHEIGKRFENAYNDIISIINTQNPFSSIVDGMQNELHQVHLLYNTFDKVRNTINQSSTKIQQNFEKYLEYAEGMIEEIRNLSLSLAETGVALETVNESKASDIIKVIKKEILNFKKWIEKRVKKMKQLNTLIQSDLDMIQKSIQKEFSSVK
jgi:hypothetical protein